MPTEAKSIKRCVALAAHLGAGISAVSFELDVPLVGGPYTRPFMTDGLVVENSEHEKSLGTDLRIRSSAPEACVLRGASRLRTRRERLCSSALTIFVDLDQCM